uniref:BF3164 family lipoprotein n=1 Tax=uncultured Bacteroides sp. TaxID=162156 RepID=UPI0025987BED
KEIGQSIQQGESLQDGGRCLYVFSLTGAPLRRYILDRHVCGIAVDEKRRILWTTDVNSDEPLVKFNLWQK